MVLTRVGQTAEGKTVYARVYKFFETHGMPLDTLLGILREKNVIPLLGVFSPRGQSSRNEAREDLVKAR